MILTVVLGAVVLWAIVAVIHDRVRHIQRARRADRDESTARDVEEGLSELDGAGIHAQQVERWRDTKSWKRGGPGAG